jgi:hypothetical protein
MCGPVKEIAENAAACGHGQRSGTSKQHAVTIYTSSRFCNLRLKPSNAVYVGRVVTERGCFVCFISGILASNESAT